MADEIDLQEVHDFLVTIAQRAGERILAATGPASSISATKSSGIDLVTETDQAVEKMVSEALREKYPDFKFMGEETYKPGDTLTPSPTFIVDPIDGTTNFIHTFPWACISLGLCVNLTPVVGVIYNPFLSTLYTAISGKGAYMTSPTIGRQRLPLRPQLPIKALADCLLITEWGHGRSGPDYELKTRVFSKLCQAKSEGGAMVHSIRSLGSAALNMCTIAAGQADVYWEVGPWAWDVCAAWVVLMEAGGRIVGAHPGEWKAEVDGRSYLAVRAGGEGEEWKGVVEELWSYVDGRFEGIGK